MEGRPPITNPNLTNPRKIHSAVFIENVEEFLAKYTADKVMDTLQEAYSKYKMMETTLIRSKESMKVKIPEITKAMEIIDLLEKKQEEEKVIDFLITDAVWAKGKIPKGTNKVSLWLGANIMVEYSFEEAKALLTRNLENALSNFKVFEEDLSFLKDQITTVEVNIARVYNTNLKSAQQQRLNSVKPQA